MAIVDFKTGNLKGKTLVYIATIWVDGLHPSVLGVYSTKPKADIAIENYFIRTSGTDKTVASIEEQVVL